MSIQLKQSALAKLLTPHELRQLAQAGEERVINAGTVLLAEGQVCDTLHLLLAGRLAVLKTEKLGTKTLSTEELGHLEPGETIGEIGLLLPMTSPVTFQAATDCQVFALSQVGYAQWQTSEPALHRKLAANIAQDFDHKLTGLMEQVTSLLSDHKSLVHTVERLQATDQAQNTPELQAQLKWQLQQFQTKANALKQRANVLSQERNTAHAMVRKTQLLVGLMGGAIALLLMGNIMGWSKVVTANGGGDRTESTAHPTVIPYITTESHCKKRAGSRWIDEQCLDFEHDPSF